jgi:hypothetical protein
MSRDTCNLGQPRLSNFFLPTKLVKPIEFFNSNPSFDTITMKKLKEFE